MDEKIPLIASGVILFTLLAATLFLPLLCKTDKEKKNLRMKLRKKLDAFIAEFIATSKNEEKRKALRKARQEYAKQVYINSACIVDANANTEKKDTIKNFLLAMNETEKKNK